MGGNLIQYSLYGFTLSLIYSNYLDQGLKPATEKILMLYQPISGQLWLDKVTWKVTETFEFFKYIDFAARNYQF